MPALPDLIGPDPDDDDRWAVGVGDALARLVPGPEVLDELLRLLNRFGGVAISDGAVEYDGDSVDWDDVSEIRTHALLGYLFSGALDRQVDRLPLPWFPFRGLLVETAAQVALTALVAATGPVLGATREVRIPSDVRYRGLLRDRELSPGVLAALLLAVPTVQQEVLSAAQRHGVTVRRADHDALDDAERRARQVRSMVASVAAALYRAAAERNR
ncbi:hypothetical protein JRC04_12000 [Mycolicibacterium sp. S2-37]|uniref:hypothetical protein n=1 Tax=Mycolicibacterium sp. S2-37 TaxID=2810297 RepID=UPI001A94BCC2|nr:hypothetical protein [Mycolicibacterium sp. S2-37]MBO0678185.1 hypothetical protein [Mycolicibacterium sp. S2-37]